MITIGISYTTTNFSFYWDWFTPEERDQVELVRLSFEEGNVEDLDRCDGLLLTGGIDIEPSRYGRTASYPFVPDAYQVERDRFEEQLYRKAMQAGLPLLGICRGFQLVNVLEGGTLVQDLGPDNAVHKKESSDKEHEIAVVRGSFLFEATGMAVGKVNSAHHQAIKEEGLSNIFRPAAYSFDEEKIIEAFEYREKEGKPFLLCVQWHPERMADRDRNPFSIVLKRAFLAAIKTKKHEDH